MYLWYIFGISFGFRLYSRDPRGFPRRRQSRGPRAAAAMRCAGAAGWGWSDCTATLRERERRRERERAGETGLDGARGGPQGLGAAALVRGAGTRVPWATRAVAVGAAAACVRSVCGGWGWGGIVTWVGLPGSASGSGGCQGGHVLVGCLEGVLASGRFRRRGPHRPRQGLQHRARPDRAPRRRQPPPCLRPPPSLVLTVVKERAQRLTSPSASLLASRSCRSGSSG